MKQISKEICCEVIEFSTKDIKKEFFKKKGDKIQVCESKSTMGIIIPTIKRFIRDEEHEILEDINLKFIVCPICKEKYYLDTFFGNFPTEFQIKSFWKTRNTGINTKWRKSYI